MRYGMMTILRRSMCMCKSSGGRATHSEEMSAPRYAAALEYAIKEYAPIVIAKGKGILAERVLDVARQHGIPITHEEDLAERLVEIDIDEQIPPDLYMIVASILSAIISASSMDR